MLPAIVGQETQYIYIIKADLLYSSISLPFFLYFFFSFEFFHRLVALI
jgi:hypothetical protein